jgi:hypothetical protein
VSGEINGKVSAQYCLSSTYRVPKEFIDSLLLSY